MELDTDKNGFITHEDFRVSLERQGVFYSEKDIALLVRRYDRDQDGKVSYSEFVREVTPKKGFY